MRHGRTARATYPHLDHKVLQLVMIIVYAKEHFLPKASMKRGCFWVLAQ